MGVNFLKYPDNKNWIFFFMFLLVIIDRLFLLFNFNFQYVGSDDLIFWQGAADYSKGIFHEPYFYGQNYNFMLESLVAVPFIKPGIPFQYVLPVCSSFIILFPFFLFACLFFKNGNIIESFIFLSLPLLLPVEYGLMTSITRGFTSGLFFSGLFVFCLIAPERKRSYWICASALALGYLFNPNSLVFAVPIVTYLFLKNYKRPSFYFINLLLIACALLIEYFAKRFYLLNPDYNVCAMWILQFSWQDLLSNLEELEKFFGYLTPVFWHSGYIVLPVLIILSIACWKEDWRKGVSLSTGVIFIIVLLGINKVGDDAGTVFLSSARMFLGIPLFLALAFSWSKNRIPVSNKSWTAILLILSSTAFIFKAALGDAIVKRITVKTNYAAIAIKNISELDCDCLRLQDVARQNNVDLIILVPSAELNVPAMEFYNYGCSLLEKEFPSTLLSIYEKRTWIYQKEKKAVHQNILIYGSEIASWEIKNIANTSLLPNQHRLILIKDNKLSTQDLLRSFRILLKRNIPPGNRVTKKTIWLKASNNKYVCADDNPNNIILANRDEAHEWETFILSSFENGDCTIQSYKNLYWSAELGSKNEITAGRNEFGPWEKFILIRLNNNHLALKAANGKYLGLNVQSTFIIADRDSIGENEKFELTSTSQAP